jgi:hypothetical protein
MNRDLFHNILISQSLAPATLDTPVDGTGISVAGYESAVAVLDVGIQTGSSVPTINMKLQHSDELAANYVDVPTADIIDGTSSTVTIVAATDNMVHMLGYIGSKKYLRWIYASESGTTPAAPMAGLIIVSNPRHAPTS